MKEANRLCLVPDWVVVISAIISRNIFEWNCVKNIDHIFIVPNKSSEGVI